MTALLHFCTAHCSPINTYGAAGIVWGWAAAPCKPCPRCVSATVCHTMQCPIRCAVLWSLCVAASPLAALSQPQHSLTVPHPLDTRVCSKPPFPAPHRNMITDGQIKVNNSEVCINDDGFGYASEGEC